MSATPILPNDTGANLQQAKGLPRNAILLILPAIAFLAVLFIVPMLRLFSLGFQQWQGGPFMKLITDDIYLIILWNTLVLAAIVTVFSLVIGYPVAYFLATTSRRLRTLGFVAIMIPLWTSIVVRNYAWMVLLGRNGPVNDLLLATGITSSRIIMLGTTFAVVIGMVHVMTPFMVLPIYSSVKRVDPALALAARGMGASSLRVFLNIHLPLTLRGILAGTTLVFVVSLGFFITPALLGGGKVMMISMIIADQVSTFLDWNFASALALVLLVITLIAVGVFNGVIGRFIKS